MYDIISLVGLMGVGKTTIGSNLALNANYEFIDSDIFIEKIRNISISDFFQKFGEEKFREVETATIKHLLKLQNNSVLATGGGFYTNDVNVSLLNKNSFVCWLDCDLEIIVKRIKADNTRPLLAKNNNKKKELEKLYTQRKSFYQQANMHIDVSKKPTEEIVQQIWDSYQKWKK